MPHYLLLLYAPETDEPGAEQRWAEMPRWQEVTTSLREAGMLVGNNALFPVESATTVRVRDGSGS